MYILKYIDLENDEMLDSQPVCLKLEESGEINCLGVLVKREITSKEYEGENYYQFVYFYGRSPVNFNRRDYQKLEKDYAFDLEVEMIADFRYCYSEYRSFPGLGLQRNKSDFKDTIDLMQVSMNNRFH